MVSLPVIIVGILTAVIGIIVFIGRNCCGCLCKNGSCGGRVPSRGICCGERLGRNDGYTLYSRRMYFLAVVSILILVIIAMTVGFSGNTKMSQGIGALLDITVNTPTNIHNTINEITAELTALQQEDAKVNGKASTVWSTINSGLNSTDAVIKDLIVRADKAHKKVKSIENSRKHWLHWGFILPAILAGVAVLGYFCPILVTCIVLPGVFMATIIVWIALGVHVPVSVLTADFCVGLNHDLRYPNATPQVLDMVMKCPKVDPSLTSSTSTYLDQAYATSCTTLNSSLCLMAQISYYDDHGATTYLDPVKCPNIPCNANTLARYINETVVNDFQWGCATLVSGNIETKNCQYMSKTTAENSCESLYGERSVRPCLPSSTGSTDKYRVLNLTGCGDKCLINSTKSLAYATVGNYDIISKFGTINSEQVTPLINCSMIREAMVSLENSLCYDVSNGIDYVIAGLSIIGICFFLGLPVYLGAQKRFNRTYWDDIYREKTFPELEDPPPEDPEDQRLLAPNSNVGSQNQI